MHVHDAALHLRAGKDLPDRLEEPLLAVADHAAGVRPTPLLRLRKNSLQAQQRSLSAKAQPTGLDVAGSPASSATDSIFTTDTPSTTSVRERTRKDGRGGLDQNGSNHRMTVRRVTPAEDAASDAVDLPVSQRSNRRILFASTRSSLARMPVPEHSQHRYRRLPLAVLPHLTMACPHSGHLFFLKINPHRD